LQTNNIHQQSLVLHLRNRTLRKVREVVGIVVQGELTLSLPWEHHVKLAELFLVTHVTLYDVLLKFQDSVVTMLKHCFKCNVFGLLQTFFDTILA